jgi:oligopeptide/dipeptide ABC transporter ATP-binding protein
VSGEPLLEVRNLRVEYAGNRNTVHAVNGVSLSLDQGQTLGLVGETGCGKSTVARALIGLLPPPGRVVAGEVILGGVDLLAADQRALRGIRGREVAMIFQDPLTALNPLLTIGFQIGEALRGAGLGKRARRLRTRELLQLVGLPDAATRMDSYPHELSGGMRQRVMIAMAISCSPRLLIADEPTTALDVTVQAQVLDLLSELQDELGMALLLVSHDLGIMAQVADRVHVMYAGYTVESGSVEDVLLAPGHPYTEGLIGSIAQIDEPRPPRLRGIPGSAPTLFSEATGCPFRPRCPYAVELCAEANPPLMPLGRAHDSACWVKTAEYHHTGVGT